LLQIVHHIIHEMTQLHQLDILFERALLGQKVSKKHSVYKFVFSLEGSAQHDHKYMPMRKCVDCIITLKSSHKVMFFRAHNLALLNFALLILQQTLEILSQGFAALSTKTLDQRPILTSLYLVEDALRMVCTSFVQHPLHTLLFNVWKFYILCVQITMKYWLWLY